MDTALWIINASLPLLYLGTCVAYGVGFFGERPRESRIARPLLAGTLLVHVAYLTLLTVRWHQFPAATVAQAMSALAFAVALIYLVVEGYAGSRATGVWLVAVALFFELAAAMLRSAAPPHIDRFESPLFAIHVALALVGYAGFVVAACYGFLYLRVYRDLKRGRFSRFFGALPPLEILDRMMVSALSCGFAAFALAVATGAIWAEQLFPQGWLADAKILIALATLAFYGTVLAMRRAGRLHARPLAWASLAGFGVLLFSMLPVNLFMTTLHGFG